MHSMTKNWGETVSEKGSVREIPLVEVTPKESERIARALRFVENARTVNPGMTKAEEEAIIAKNPILQLPSLPTSRAGEELENLLGALVHLSENNMINPNAFVRQGLVKEAQQDPEFQAALGRGWEIIDAAKASEDPHISKAATQLESIVGDVLSQRQSQGAAATR